MNKKTTFVWWAFPSILVTFLGETKHFSGKNGALRWSILVGKQKHNVQKPTPRKGDQRPLVDIVGYSIQTSGYFNFFWQPWLTSLLRVIKFNKIILFSFYSSKKDTEKNKINLQYSKGWVRQKEPSLSYYHSHNTQTMSNDHH